MILVPAIAKDKARFHGGELKISKRWKSFKTGALGRGPERRTARRWTRWGSVPVALAPELNYALAASHVRVGVYGGVRILNDDMAAEGLVGRL